ncbi:tyrosine phosphatase domain-containing 1-like [Brachionus plicatilis]|uniref:Tyrosine phosphatase domain-containing 1-like n=1 Tax=Brachionus plicatilis TaxID=10195 RepID=A0A3M7PCC1_BRAPC|nr:tyrosine phosphatase domain-containing 1-like [Brachionus plicatilis]
MAGSERRNVSHAMNDLQETLAELQDMEEQVLESQGDLIRDNHKCRSLNLESGESHLFTSFSLNTFLIRQRLILHGNELKKIRHIPKIIYICCRKLIKLIKNCAKNETSNTLTVPKNENRHHSNPDSSFSLNEIAESLIKTKYSSKLMKIVLEYQRLINETHLNF